jgi:hypothetical protein
LEGNRFYAWEGHRTGAARLQREAVVEDPWNWVYPWREETPCILDRPALLASRKGVDTLLQRPTPLVVQARSEAAMSVFRHMLLTTPAASRVSATKNVREFSKTNNAPCHFRHLHFITHWIQRLTDYKASLPVRDILSFRILHTYGSAWKCGAYFISNVVKSCQPQLG